MKALDRDDCIVIDALRKAGQHDLVRSLYGEAIEAADRANYDTGRVTLSSMLDIEWVPVMALCVLAPVVVGLASHYLIG